MKKEVFFGSMNQNTEMTVVITHYERLGRGWHIIDEVREKVDRQYYINTVGAKQFFNNLGGIERHTKSYTSYGYIVTNINSISPDKNNKTTRQFIFD